MSEVFPGIVSVYHIGYCNCCSMALGKVPQEAPQFEIHFSPSDLGKLSEEEKQQMKFYFAQLKQYREEIPPAYQAKLSDAQLRELSLSLLDGTVFEIVRELEDIQQLKERSLLNKRMKVVSAHKSRKVDMAKRHKKELASSSSKLHNLPLLRSQHEKERHDLEKKLAEEIRATDQKIILELDQIVSDQQSTMQQAAVPFFMVSNKPEDIQIQIHTLRFVQRLGTAAQ